MAFVRTTHAAYVKFAVDDKMVHRQIQSLQGPAGSDITSVSSLLLTVRILAADTGKIVRATIPVVKHGGIWYAQTEGQTSISGVPGTAAPVHIENHLEGNPLPSGSQRDYLSLDGEQVPHKFDK